MNTSRNSPHSPHAAGATLSEVLISLLVMSIGVVSLATLFPISVLRSLQATQLTSSANLRYNVEAFLGVNPQLYTIGTAWKNSTPYVVDDLVTPTGCCSSSFVMKCVTAGTSGTVEPNWRYDPSNPSLPPTTPISDGGAAWQVFPIKNYVVDPLGHHLVETSYRQTANGDFFGNDGTTPRQVLRAFAGVIPYYSDPIYPTRPLFQNLGTNQDLAAYYATLPDSWISQVESNVVTYTAGASTCTLGDLPYDLGSTTPVTPPPSPLPSDDYPSRIVLFDITGKISHVRPISAIGGAFPTQTITWPATAVGSGPLPNVPTGFVPVRARVETKERRYTWMLSVRRDGDSFQMEVVVFFRRPFSGKDEQVYPATFTAVTDPGYDEQPGISGATDPDDQILGCVGSDDTARNWVVVQYDGTGDKPFVKKGGYVTDADNLRWYRILNFYESDTPANVMTKAGLNRTGTIYPPDMPAYGANTKSILLRVENKIVKSGPQPTLDNSGNPTSPPAGRAILMRNIVDVYPIRTRVLGESQ